MTLSSRLATPADEQSLEAFQDAPRGVLLCSRHAANMRAWRKTHPMTAEQRRKDAARSYAGVYKRRGKLAPEPCQICGDANSQMHHSDYNRPLAVEWLCRPCHLSLHKLVGAEYDAESFKDAIADMRAVVQAAKEAL